MSTTYTMSPAKIAARAELMANLLEKVFEQNSEVACAIEELYEDLTVSEGSRKWMTISQLNDETSTHLAAAERHLRRIVKIING